MPFDELLSAMCTAANELLSRDDFVIVSHYDADGITSAAILSKALMRAGKSFHVKIVKQLYRETVSEIKSLGKNFIFSDFGSGQLEFLVENFGSDFFVLDHHQPAQVSVPLPYHFSPFNYGIDGGDEISGAGMCYLFAKSLDEKNYDLAPLAIVGAVGDMQDYRGKLLGVNEKILEEAISKKLMLRENDLRMYGRISRPLVQFLMFSSNPVLPELTANEENCIRFLEQNQIPLRENERLLTYSELSKEKKKQLTSALILHLHNHNVLEWKIKELIGEVYSLSNENPRSPLHDAKEFATLCNSCGRHGMPEVALRVCMGDRGESYNSALSLLAEHRRQLREAIEFLHSAGIEERETFYFFDSGDKIKDSIVGIVAGMLYGSGILAENKPIFAFARSEDGLIKVSGRGTQDLVYRGLNLGKLLKEICAELGDSSNGGGHKIAAGCRISPEHREKFLSLLSQKLKVQLGIRQ